jgi:hypothetical protein
MESKDKRSREKGLGGGRGGDGQCVDTMGQVPGGEVISGMMALTPNLDFVLNVRA